MKIFKYLDGQPVPEKVRAAVTCPDCGAMLALTPTGYVACDRRMHGSLRTPELVAERINDAWPLVAKRGLLPINVVRRAVAMCRVPPPPVAAKR